jgi:hypothetical protein
LPSCLTQTEAKAVWEYRDGELYWKIRPRTRTQIGDKAGHLHGNGYWDVMYKGRSYGAHRIVYLMHHGYMPESIDHIDGNPLNNRVENLRPVDCIRNGYNRRISVNNTSGVKNISKTPSGKWKIMLQSRGKVCFYALVEDFDLAALVASEARDKYHGEFARHK